MSEHLAEVRRAVETLVGTCTPDEISLRSQLPRQSPVDYLARLTTSGSGACTTDVSLPS